MGNAASGAKFCKGGGTIVQAHSTRTTSSSMFAVMKRSQTTDADSLDYVRVRAKVDFIGARSPGAGHRISPFGFASRWVQPLTVNFIFTLITRSTSFAKRARFVSLWEATSVGWAQRMEWSKLSNGHLTVSETRPLVDQY
jgi:hypothetical protein